MPEKRKHGKAFQVGPANLPDGTFKRKADRIKQALIDRARIKKDFARVKKRKLQEEPDDVPRYDPYAAAEAEEDAVSQGVADAEGAIEKAAEPHPDRQSLIDGTEEGTAGNEEFTGWSDRPEQGRDRGKRREKKNPYTKQLSFAEKQREEAERRQREREEAQRQREQKIQEREKIQRMMRKAKRPTVDGKRKLGRESEVLLEKVKRMMANGK